MFDVYGLAVIVVYIGKNYTVNSDVVLTGRGITTPTFISSRIVRNSV